MGRIPLGLNRGLWTSDEDLLLRNYVEANGEGGWTTLPIKAGVLRCGRSCRLRWMNHLRPDVKRGHIQADEEDLILRLHRLLGNRWSLIAGRIPGRTDNKIKNYWNTHLSKKLIRQGINPRTHTHFSESEDKGSNPGDRESSRKSQGRNNTTNSIAESRVDLQAVPLNGGAVAAHENQVAEGSAIWPSNNQFLQTSLTCNSRRGFVATNFWSQMPVIHSMPCAFQGHTNSTCFPEILSNSATTNDMGSEQSYLPPSTPCTCFNSSEHLTGLGHCDLHQYLMNNPVTCSNDMITSTVRLSSGLTTATFAIQFESDHGFISGTALLNKKSQMSLQNLQALEMNPGHSFTVHSSEQEACNN